MVIKIQKVRSADDSADKSASDMVHTPGRYGIFSNDVQVGYIAGQQLRYRDRQSWTVYNMNPIPGRAYRGAAFKTLAEAKAWALAHDWPQPLAKVFRHPAGHPWVD